MSNDPIEIRHGESIFIDFTTSVGNITANMVSNYTLLDSKDQVITSGSLTVVGDYKLELRIPKTDTTSLKGKYRLLVSLEDTTTGYFDYILDTQVTII